MPTIGGRYFSGFGRYSAYQSLSIQRARMAEANERSATATATLTNAFSAASTSLSQGLAELATQAAIKRMSDQAAAKVAAAKSSLNLTT